MQSPKLGQSPLTDPRSILTSTAFHAALVLLASLAVLGVRVPAPVVPSNVVHADLGPIDNRAPAEAGGGAPGELGGTDALRVDVGPTRYQDSKKADPAEALIAEAVGRPVAPEATARDLLGTAGTGVLPGEGRGGGGGSGGGSGGGIGRGVGPSTEFFGARERGHSFAYVIDCSGSMSKHRALERAKRELMASLDQLPPDATFGVIFYNLEPTVLADLTGRPGMMPAIAANKERVRALLSTIPPEGGTDHRRALEAAFAIRPEVVFFLTDARQMTDEQAEKLLEEAKDVRVQAIEFGDGPDPGTANPLKTLATATGGVYRYIDMLKQAQIAD